MFIPQNILCRRWKSRTMKSSPCALGFLVVAFFTSASLAYDNGYQPGDSWMLEESFLENQEGSGRFQQGDRKSFYNPDDPIWFYLEALPGDDAAAATPLTACGFHSIGRGWATQQVEPPDQEPPRIEGYPYIVRGAGSAEKIIYVHPGPKDLLIVWQAPVEGRYKAEATFERGHDLGDGQTLSWTAGDTIVSEVIVPAKEGATELATPTVALKKGERLYFRIGAGGSSNDDSGLAYVQVTYEGR